MKRLIPVVLAALAGAAQAQTAGSGLHPFVGLGVTGGGDTLATVEYTNGDSKSIKSGGLVEFVGGLDYREEGSPFSVRGSIAYHVDDTNAENGSVKFGRWPVELLAFWNVDDRFRLGAGLRKAAAAKLTSSGATSSLGDYNFGSDTGVVVEGEYRFLGRLGIALRYVDEKYKAPNGAKIDGSHVGVRASWYF